MTKFEDIQTLARTTIAAATYFTNWSVLADTGYSLAAAESALETNGAGVIVSPITSWSVLQQMPGSAEVEVEFMVRVRINPKLQADAGTGAVNVLEACSEVCTALLGYPGDDGETPSGPFSSDQFQLQDNALNPVCGYLEEVDAGLLEYILLFKKTAAL